MRIIVLLTMTLSLFTSCQKENTAEAQLKEFIRLRYKGEQRKDKVLKWLVDPLYTEFNSIPDEDFEKTMGVGGRKLKDIRVLTKNCDSEANCFLTFIIKFETYGNDKKLFTSEVKKLANLKKIENSWKIADINNVKTYHDSHVPIEP